MLRRCAMVFTLVVVVLAILIDRAPRARAEFELTFSIDGSFTTSQRENLEDAIDYAEALWESVVTGYEPGISVSGIEISVQPDATIGLADALVTSTTTQGGFVLATGGRIRVQPAVADFWASWDGTGPTPPNTEFVGVNYLDDILAHEVGHMLGLGSLWVSNGLYVNGTNQYTGEHGLAAYQDEFDQSATFIPVENAGGAGRRDVHWDQIVRSSPEEGVPSDPWTQDPTLGITDDHGRDFAFELLTATFDPDYGEPFLSHTTVQSLRDLGFTVVPEPTSTALLLVGMTLIANRRTRAVRATDRR